MILKDGERVATIAFKFPKDGAGRLNVFVHWIGLEMVKGQAGGYGYDKKSAACANASEKLLEKQRKAASVSPFAVVGSESMKTFRAALAKNDGYSWDRNLESAGFTVFQAV